MTIIYIYGHAKIDIIDGNNKTGATSGRIEEPLVVRVTDANNRAVSGVAVKFDETGGAGNGMFIPIPGTTVYLDADGSLEGTLDTDSYSAEVDPNDIPDAKGAINVQTNSGGEARFYYVLSDMTGLHLIDATLANDITVEVYQPFRATAVAGDISARLVLVSGDGQRGEAETLLDDPLVVRVRNIYDDRISGVNVRFTTTEGIISLRRGSPSNSDAEDLEVDGEFPDNTRPIRSGEEIFAKTDASGEVWVVYTVGSNAGSQTVRAEIASEQSTNLEYDFETRPVTFNINGRAAPAPAPEREREPAPAPAPVTPLPSLSADISGAPGSQQTLSVSTNAAAQVTVGQSGDNFLTAGGLVSQSSFTGSRAVTITLPNTVGAYTLTVTATTTGGTVRDPRTIRVVEADNGAQPGSQPGTGGTVSIGIQPSSGGPGTTATVTVTATPAASVAVTLRITAGGGTFANGTTTTTVTTGTTGTTAAILTLGSAPGSNYYITVSLPTGYTFRGPSSGERVIISGAQPPTGGAPTTTGPASELDDYDGNNQSGSLNSRLAEPFVVEVVDANDNPVEDVRVRFSTMIGSGRFSPRTPRTDEDGFAETTFTPTSAGRIRVVATVAGVDDTAAFTVQAGDPADALVKVSGDTQSGTPGNALAAPFVVEVQDEDGEPLTGHSVTFSVTAGGGSLSETSATTNANGRAQTTLTLGSALGVNSVQASVSGVDSVTFSTSIDAKILVTAANRPMMYWIAGGGLYSLSGAKEAKIAESANGVAVGGGKIYWTSQVNASSGAINSANLDGTGATTLTTILAVPMGIAVDTAGK